MNKLSICQFPCGCSSCGIKIGKGELFLELYKQARRGVARINICARCIVEFAKEIPPKDIQAIENRLALKELSEVTK